MNEHAHGTFEVKIVPQPPDNPAAESAALGRMSLDKRYVGDLDATGQGEMLAFRSAVEGSAGYVALERVNGTLHGRRGSFVLQHSGTMDRGTPSLSVSVVPDSGTDALVGLRGSLRILIAEGRHSYEFDYGFDETA